MKFGVALPTGYEGLIYPPPFASPESITRIVVAAGRLAYDSVMPNDHFTTQNYVRQMAQRPPNYFDPFVTLAYVAAHTRRIRLMTGVIVLPLRDPVSVAKQAASLDQFCQGRLVLGVGIGAYREEFEAVRPERRGWNRGAMLAEATRAIRLLFEKDNASFDGRYWRFEGVQMYPKPVQQPLPIYIGGNAEANLHRAVEMGQGWLPAVMSPDEIRASLAKARALAEEGGRDLAGFEVAPQLIVSVGRSHEEAVAKFHRSHAYKHLVSLQTSTLRGQQGGFEQRNLIGSHDQIRERVRAYADAGATELSGLIFTVDTVDEFIASMEDFAEHIMSAFRPTVPAGQA